MASGKNMFSSLNWLFVVLALGALGVGLFLLPPAWKIGQAALIISLALVVFYNTYTKNTSTAKLYVEHERQDVIINNLHEGVIVYDQDFKILLFNTAAEEIFGVSKKEVLGQIFTAKIREGGASKLRPLLTILFPALAPTIIRRSENGSYPQVMDISLDNPALEVRVTTNRLFDESGKLLGFIKLIQDRTRELTLLRSKSEFITVASHQLRTPLTGASWALEGLEKETLTPEQKELADTAAGAVTRLLKVVNDLLDIAKIEEGKFGYQFQEISIISFLEEQLSGADPIAKQYQVKVYFEKPQEDIKITADPAKLGLALSNLLDNAIKYNIPNGEVTVKVAKIPNKQYIEITIKDTGIGIPSDAIESVFKKFYRGENATKIAVEGSGLGMYIAKNIVKRHGGDIKAESTLNRGTTISIILPTNYLLIPPKEFTTEEE